MNPVAPVTRVLIVAAPGLEFGKSNRVVV
jgi:hypothetical protein